MEHQASAKSTAPEQSPSRASTGRGAAIRRLLFSLYASQRSSRIVRCTKRHQITHCPAGSFALQKMPRGVPGDGPSMRGGLWPWFRAEGGRESAVELVKV
ncbi:hypothetical protein Jann_1093 [Jannaschia sp. CCS1]|nr:hypothetical protein Jann_1093 [Jannaschia sp. CCS1]